MNRVRYRAQSYSVIHRHVVYDSIDY